MTDPLPAQSGHEELDFLRAMIDNIDSAIMAILAHRAQVITYIQQYKVLHHIAPQRSEQREQVVEELLQFAAPLKLRPAFVKTLLENLCQQSSVFLQTSQHQHLPTFFATQNDLLTDLNRTLKHLDMSFLSLLSERMQLVRQVGVFKKMHHLPPLAQARWEQVLSSKIALAEKMNINPAAIDQFYHLIHQEALEIEVG